MEPSKAVKEYKEELVKSQKQNIKDSTQSSQLHNR
jgi:hypothetical protein